MPVPDDGFMEMPKKILSENILVTDGPSIYLKTQCLTSVMIFNAS
jgi:hypothetical protein